MHTCLTSVVASHLIYHGRTLELTQLTLQTNSSRIYLTVVSVKSKPLTNRVDQHNVHVTVRPYQVEIDPVVKRGHTVRMKVTNQNFTFPVMNFRTEFVSADGRFNYTDSYNIQQGRADLSFLA